MAWALSQGCGMSLQETLKLGSEKDRPPAVYAECAKRRYLYNKVVSSLWNRSCGLAQLLSLARRASGLCGPQLSPAPTTCISAAAFRAPLRGQNLLVTVSDRGASSAGVTFALPFTWNVTALVPLQGITLPAALSAVTQIFLHEHRCAGNALSPNGEGFLACTSQMLLVLVWLGRMLYQTRGYGM